MTQFIYQSNTEFTALVCVLEISQYSSRNCPYHRVENSFDNKRERENKHILYRMQYAISVSGKKLEKFLLRRDLK